MSLLLLFNQGGGEVSSYTLTGPTSAVVGQVLAYVLEANGATTATVTMHQSGGSGVFSPTTIALSGTQGVAFVFVPGTSGTYILSTTNDGGLTDPSPIILTVTQGNTLILGPWTISGGISG